MSIAEFVQPVQLDAVHEIVPVTGSTRPGRRELAVDLDDASSASADQRFEPAQPSVRVEAAAFRATRPP